MPRIIEQQLNDFMGESNTTSQVPKKPAEASTPNGAVQNGSSGLAVSTGGRGAETVTNANPERAADYRPNNTASDMPLRNGRGGQPVRKPTESSANVTSSTDIEGMIRDGWSIPTIAKENTTTDVIEGDAETLNDESVYKAVDALHDRWNRSGKNEFGYHAVLS